MSSYFSVVWFIGHRLDSLRKLLSKITEIFILGTVVGRQVKVNLAAFFLKRNDTLADETLILPPQNVSLSKAVLMRKGGEDDEVKAGTLHA
jgi:hypothetical protein